MTVLVVSKPVRNVRVVLTGTPAQLAGATDAALAAAFSQALVDAANALAAPPVQNVPINIPIGSLPPAGQAAAATLRALEDKPRIARSADGARVQAELRVEVDAPPAQVEAVASALSAAAQSRAGALVPGATVFGDAVDATPLPRQEPPAPDAPARVTVAAPYAVSLTAVLVGGLLVAAFAYHVGKGGAQA